MTTQLRHLLGFVAATCAALLFLTFLAPRSERDLPLVYMGMALIPLLLWAFPGFVRAITRGSFAAHRATAGKEAFYVRLPREGEPKVWQTGLMALGPFAIDLLVMAEILYLEDPLRARALRGGLLSSPILFALAGFLSSLLPGLWLLDALDLRVVNPRRGSVARVAEFFERVVGPAAAVLALVSFVTLLHSVGYSYEEGLVLLSLWTARLFPPVFGTAVVYRLIVEPRVLPRLQAWCDTEGIPMRASISGPLAALRGAPAPTDGPRAT